MKETIRILAAQDFHCGSMFGLTPPRFQTPAYQEWQKPHWDFFHRTVENIGPVDAFVGTGDLVDGPGRRDTVNHTTTDVRKQIKMAIEAIACIEAKKKFIVRGTGYHTDGGMSFEDSIADHFGVEAQDEARIEIYGRLLHFRHVVGRSDIPYGQYTQVGKELINELLQAEMENYKAADAIFRGHVHYCVGVSVVDGARGIVRQGWTMPALQLRGPNPGSYARGLRTWLYHVGVTLIEIEPNGEIFVRPIIFPIQNYMQRSYECLA